MGQPIRAIELVGMWAFLLGGTVFTIGYFPTAFALHAGAFKYPADAVTTLFRLGTSLYETGCLCLTVNSAIQGTDKFAIATNIVLCIAVAFFFLGTWGSEQCVTVPRYVFAYPDGDFPNPFFFNVCGVYGSIVYHLGTSMLLWNVWPTPHKFMSFWGGALCFWVAIALITYFGFIIPILGPVSKRCQQPEAESVAEEGGAPKLWNSRSVLHGVTGEWANGEWVGKSATDQTNKQNEEVKSAIKELKQVVEQLCQQPKGDWACSSVQGDKQHGEVVSSITELKQIKERLSQIASKK